MFKMVTLLGSGALLTVRKYGQLGIRQHNLHPPLMSISASIGQCATPRLAGLGDLPMPLVHRRAAGQAACAPDQKQTSAQLICH